MAGLNTDRIRKEITLSATTSRVWRALIDSAEFGEWFGARLDGPFREGEKTKARSTHPGFEHLEFVVHVERIEPERSFAFRWCPYALDPDVDYSHEPTTLVEFVLSAAEGGTLLTVTESGFDSIPEKHRKEAFLRNEGGWTMQVENIKSHIDG